MATKRIWAMYTDGGVPKTGLTPTFSAWERDGTVHISAQTMTEHAAPGQYYYDDTNYDDTGEVYRYYADGGATLADFERYKWGSNILQADHDPLHADVLLVKAKTDNLPTDPADASVVAAGQAAIIVEVDANETKIDTMQVDVTAILTDTNEIQGKLPTGDIHGEPAGARAITLHFQESDTTPIPDVMCYIRNAADDTTLWTVGPSDVGGDITVSLDDATYNLRPVKTLVTWTTVPQPMTVTADATVNVEGTVQSPSAASGPNLCVIYGTVRDAGGNVLIGSQVEIYADTPQVVSGVQMGKRIAHTPTNAIGYFELEAEKLAEVRLVIPDAEVDAAKTVPDAANQDIATWT
jgi:hypothetical protein